MRMRTPARLGVRLQSDPYAVTDMSRLDALRAKLDRPLLVSGPVNLRYLTGFVSSNAALLVERERARLFTDFRYADAARAVEGVEAVQTRRNLYGHLPELIEGEIAFEAEHLTYGSYESLAAGQLELVPVRGLVEALREVKDEGELSLVKQAAAITNEVYERLAEQRFAGRTEKEIARWMEVQFLELGADSLAFAIAVAAGANGALPHGKPGERLITAGTTVVVDAGCTVAGYNSDCTRTFATGVLSDEVRHAYDVCLRAQLAGLEAVVSGRSGVEVDRAAREVIEAEGLGETFGHGLGHGVGLEVHEGPYLNQESTGTLAVRNVVTVEPGIYLNGLAGVRIEDLVVVRGDGIEVLTTFPKELVTVS